MDAMKPLRFPPACRYAMPQQRCCNCGTMSGRRTIDVAVPVPPPMLDLPDRARRWLMIQLPFCRACESSAQRTPPGWIRMAIGGLLAAIYLVVLSVPVMTALGYGDRKVGGIVLWALVASLLAGPAWRFAQRRSPGQSSAFAPVRISTLTTRGEDVVSMRFDFTNADYARDFAAAHAALVTARTLECRVVAGH